MSVSASSTVKLVYILYLVGIVVGVVSIIGVVVAYVNRSGSAPWLRSHFDFQIWTFWAVLLLTILGIWLLAARIGILILVCVAVWVAIRCAKGIKYLDQGSPVPNPRTLLW